MHDNGPTPEDPPVAEVGQPAALSRRERAVVLARIGALMEYWGITVDDLLAPTPEPEAPPPVAGPLPVKYRHPVTGETWDGQGAHPDWLRRALLKEGLRVDELKPDPA
jgi:DNA-binding protein H-NS